MTRETRANLIFLAVILALLTPGAVILFRKKLAPTLKPMRMPEGVPTEIAYLSPLETPPGRKRVEPPHTAKWVESLVQDHASRSPKVSRPTGLDGLPMVSERKSFEVVAVEPGNETTRLWLILWKANGDDDAGKWVFRSERADLEVTAEPAVPIAVPPLVREELGELGVTRPPHEIRWQTLELRGRAPSEGRLIRPDGDIVNFVPSFTNSAATGN